MWQLNITLHIRNEDRFKKFWVKYCGKPNKANLIFFSREDCVLSTYCIWCYFDCHIPNASLLNTSNNAPCTRDEIIHRSQTVKGEIDKQIIKIVANISNKVKGKSIASQPFLMPIVPLWNTCLMVVVR